ncbi:reverse transcriptase [Acanthamoeba castellanii str. Neff]|uniref:Reverse transcriptase n=1 Tax=Acanthamoeba castellanii (strain ATCC 30010 / Neff) TaxID=1257118 RepID=L8GNK2_ACACF|nr:reverse transcriptase [Acanthamoeba castellanii str. Neff]ELR14557.1 reverse transcriptase [Acanthamoeba castellanii str. Neff]
MGGSIYRSSMDLILGYWQVALHKEDKEKTAFSMGSGLYKFNVMPFGLTNTLALFQRNMEALLSGLTWLCCLIYIDNIIIYSQTFEEHLVHLQSIFNHLWQGWMYLKLSKCVFFCQELLFLRHLLMKEGLKPDPTKVTTIQDTWPPWLVQEVHCFLGLANYYQWFIKGFTEIAKPLHWLMGKHVAFQWEQAHQEAFKTLKQRLTNAPIIIQPRQDQPYTLHMDASAHTISAVLTQPDDKGHKCIIAYGSQTLKDAKHHYSPTHHECLAVFKWVKAYQHYLHSHHFTVVTHVD